MRKIIKGDLVVLIAGKDKNKKGKVISVVNDGNYVVVEGLNMASKAVRPNPQRNVTGGIIKKEVPIHVSNVMLFDEKNNCKTRVGFSVVNGEKKRLLKKSGLTI